MASYSHFYRLQWIVYFLTQTLLYPCLIYGNSFLSTAKQAENLFCEKLYGDALSLYSQLFHLTQEKEIKVQWALRLASCHLEEKQPQIALNLLSSLDTSFYYNQKCFLMSLAHRQLGNSSQALYLLQQCTSLASEHANHLIALEQGYHLMQMGDFTQAQKILKSIPWQVHDPILYELAQLQLAKILLMNHQEEEALHILHLLSPHSPLHIEITYLKGWALLTQQQAREAAICFEELLPQTLTFHAHWSIKVLNGLIVSYLREAMQSESADQLSEALSKADQLLQELIKRDTTEASFLLLADYYLIKAKYLSDPYSYAKAQLLLDQTELFSSSDGIKAALLKRAAAAPSYQERKKLYEKLSTQPDFSSTFQAHIWFLKGLNDLEEGFHHKKEIFNQPTIPFEEAAHAFMKTIQLETHPHQIALAHKYLALTYLHLSDHSHTQLAWQILQQLTANYSLLSSLKNSEEIHCLFAWTALRLNEKEAMKTAQSHLQHHPTKHSFWQERYLKLEGMIAIRLKEWKEADLIFDRLLQNASYISSHSEAWFWRAYCAAQQQQEALRKDYLQRAYTQDHQSPYAPLAYFHLYSYRDYMQGKRKTIKHLQAMPVLFSHHPLLISAYYLIGLYYKKDDFSPEGHIIRRKDLTAAIDAFQLAESTFDTLVEKQAIPPSDFSYFIHIRYQAQLERAQANLATAQHATGGKRQIYLKYAEDVFKQLIQDVKNRYTLFSDSTYPKMWAKAELGLAKVYEEKQEWQEAENILNLSLKNYRDAHVEQGYELMQVWYMKGKLAHKQAQPEFALQYLLEAEKAVQGLQVLSPSEKLDLWIQQSMCYKALNKLDQSMRLLSQVINDDVISPLRIRAMFLRAEIYELQGRPELAMKQLEAIVHKGGEWAQKAKEKLDKMYGY